MIFYVVEAQMAGERQYRSNTSIRRKTGLKEKEDELLMRETRTKPIQAPLIPSNTFLTLKEQPRPIETKYSLICLLTERDAPDKFKDMTSKSQIFNKPYECLSEVVNSVGQEVILIASQSLSKHLIPLIHDLIQVIYIYILYKHDSYCTQEDDSYVNDNRYPKVRGSFIEQTMLLSTLHEDIKQLSEIPSRQQRFFRFLKENTNTPFYVISNQSSPFKLLNNTEQDFVSFQLIIKTILESDDANPFNNVNTLLTLGIIVASKDREKLFWETNDQFRQNYASDKAINLYLTNTTLKDELNKCFSSNNMQRICESWFIIRDLLKQLSQNGKLITVYREQYLTVDQLEILKTNVGGFVAFTRFISMSTSYIRTKRRNRRNDIDRNIKSVIFQVEIDKNNAKARFLMTQQNREELMILFAVGSVFSIESIEEFNDESCLCKLRSNSDGESLLTQMVQYYETEIGTSLTYLSLGVYLNQIGKEDLARQYYDTLLLVEQDPAVMSSIYNNLAIISERNEDLTNAHKYWKQASDMQRASSSKISTALPDRKSDVVMAEPIYSTSPILNHYNLACMYRQAGDFYEALKECENALALPIAVSDTIQHALVYSAEGSVYYSQKQYEDALNCFKKALDIVLVHLPADDHLIDQYLNNVRLLKDLIDQE